MSPPMPRTGIELWSRSGFLLLRAALLLGVVVAGATLLPRGSALGRAALLALTLGVAVDLAATTLGPYVAITRDRIVVRSGFGRRVEATWREIRSAGETGAGTWVLERSDGSRFAVDPRRLGDEDGAVLQALLRLRTGAASRP